MTVSAAGLISMPATTDADVGSQTVTVRVSDGLASVDTSFGFSVTNVEEAPLWSAIANQGANEDATFQLQVTATDPDPGASVTYALVVAPSGMTMSSSRIATSGVVALLKPMLNVSQAP